MMGKGGSEHQLPHEEQQNTFDPNAAQPDRSAHADCMALGLLPAPEIPEKIAIQLSTQLPDLLSQNVDDRVSWNVSVVCDPLTGSEPDAVRVIDAGHERMHEEGWDLAICLTDLPIRNDGRPVVAALSTARNLAVISLPPLGVTLLHRRVREGIVQLVNELYDGSPVLARADDEERDDRGVDAGTNAGEARRPSQRPHQLVRRRLTELISPIRRITPTDDDDVVDVRFVSPTIRGHLRLLGGMVLANRPWRLFTTMKSALAAAFATAAYALVMPIIWQM